VFAFQDARNPTPECDGFPGDTPTSPGRATIAAMSDAATPSGPAAQRFQEPGWFTRHVFNPAVNGLMALGISIAGSRVLEVKGRKSGEWRSIPVNLLEVDGTRYLVAPRGNTQWVRNMRVAGGGRLRLGRRTEDFKATEVPLEPRVPILRAYLRKWKWEVGAFFDGVGPDASDAELLAIADEHPVFRIQ
jgi:deazaflavin-dependent oxidoreductase (nitroreductase family)